MAGRGSPAFVGRVYGVVFLALCVLFVWFTYAIFTKQFSDYDEVTLQSTKTGLALPARADVKIRGVIVGEVLETTTTGDGAELTLGLYPDERETVPKDVSAQILPKTLFGEKYIALEVPPNASDEPIRPGAVIKQSEVSIELEKVLNDLYPLLRTVQPAELNFTLTAIANALEGRGNEIGEGLETLDSYLKRMNPEIPGLIDSIVKTGSVSAVYESVVPDLTRLLRNTVTTTNTFQSKEDQIQALFNDVAGFSGTAETFLRRNGDNMITLANQGARILPLLARYAPEYRCFLRGIVDSIAPNEEAFRNKTLHIKLETVPRQPRGYNVNDRPRNGDSRGPYPYCAEMYRGVSGFYGQERLIPLSLVPNINDGVDEPTGKTRQRAGVGPMVADSVAATQDEQAVLDLAAAPVLGVDPSEVPDLSTLLLGPLARGMEVDVR